MSNFPVETYDALARVRDTVLVRFDSLFDGADRHLWSLQNLETFRALFVEKFDDGEGAFLEKFHTQLKDGGDDVLQLAAEMLYVQQFFTSLTGHEKKLENVQAVLSWCDRKVVIPAWAITGIRHGHAGDQSFNQHRPNHLTWITEFLIAWHAVPSAERAAKLNDVWAFRQFTQSIESVHGAHQPMREAWTFLMFPDSFEPISSRRDKKLIRSAFAHLLPAGTTDNIDADLLAIRTALTKDHGPGFHYYRAPLIEQWQVAKKLKAPAKPQPSTVAAEATRANEPSPEVAYGASLDALGAELLLEPASILSDWADHLLDAHQLILQGPPGTGKTFLARKLANALCGRPDNVELIQFHPSYAYEDLVEGYRPTANGGFALKDGPLKRLAQRARDAKGQRFVLIIDEINRGNLAKVLGELYFLLEYRDESITLQYSEASFSLPNNLYLIGTMNTADRSIALLDMAIRRRFRFVDVRPDLPPIKGLLARFLHAKARVLSFLANMLDDVNQRLDDPHAAVGPSHFLLKDMSALTEKRAEMIWTHSVLPAIADRFFDDPAQLAKFAYAYVRTNASDQPTKPAGPESAEEADDDDSSSQAD